MKTEIGRETTTDQAAEFLDALVKAGSPRGPEAPARTASEPRLAALKQAGTRHVYADTADADELEPVIRRPDGALMSEVDGSTANQPLVKKVAERWLAEPETAAAIRALRDAAGDLPEAEFAPAVYLLLLGRIGNEMRRRFGAGRAWEPSLQIHMGLARRPTAARTAGRVVRAMVPGAFVKIPFLPDAPHCFLVARDLEREGIPVNFTSTFSARQAVAAALLSDVSRTNVFLGRVNQTLSAEYVGEQATLEAQRALARLRQSHGVKTELIVASMRDWRNFVDLAGCDVYTAPVPVLKEFLARPEAAPDRIASRRHASYTDRITVSEKARDVLTYEGIARMWRVEEEFTKFLLELRSSPDYDSMTDGEELAARFEAAGFGDFFHLPDEAEQAEIAANKLPDLASPLTRRLPLDTHLTLRANADFTRTQT